jgi:hypothetical protein
VGLGLGLHLKELGLGLGMCFIGLELIVGGKIAT